MTDVFIKGLKEEIIKPILATSGVIEKKQTLPILGNILIEKRGQDVTMVGSDLQLQVTAHAQIGIGEDDYSATVAARKLVEILNTFKDKQEVAFHEKKNQVKLTVGNSKFDLQMLDAENFPRMREDIDFVKAFTMSCVNFKHILTMVQFATDVQSNRFYLNGIYLSVEDKQVQAVATDGHRLSYIEKDLEELCEKKCSAILPKKTTKELMRLIPDSEDLLTVFISENQIKVVLGQLEILSTLIEGRYPDYQRVIPTTNEKVFIVNREQFGVALQRVAILTTDKVKNVRWNLEPDFLTVTVANTEMEEASDQIPIDYKGEPLEINFNVSYFQDMLNVVKSENIKVSLGSAISSALVEIPDSDKYKFVVMPIRM